MGIRIPKEGLYAKEIENVQSLLVRGETVIIHKLDLFARKLSDI